MASKVCIARPLTGVTGAVCKVSCLSFIAQRPRRREGLLGTGTSGKRGTEEWNLETGADPEDQGCRGPPQEQQDVKKAVSVRHCAATTAPRNCCPNCYAEQSHKDNVRSSAVGKQLKQKKSNSQTQLHLPALDLFWATSLCESSSPPSSWSRLDSAHRFLLHDIIIQKWCELTCRCLIVNTKDFFKLSLFMILLLCRYPDVYHWGTVSAVWSNSIIISTWIFSAPHASHSLFKILAYHWKFSLWAFVFCTEMLTCATILLYLFLFLIYM